MITIQISLCGLLSQAYYDEIVNAVPLDRLQCSCGRFGSLVRHAYYIRKIKITLRTAKEMRYFADLISQRFNNAGNKKTIESEMLRCL